MPSSRNSISSALRSEMKAFPPEITWKETSARFVSVLKSAAGGSWAVCWPEDGGPDCPACKRRGQSNNGTNTTRSHAILPPSEPFYHIGAFEGMGIVRERQRLLALKWAYGKLPRAA